MVKNLFAFIFCLLSGLAASAQLSTTPNPGYDPFSQDVIIKDSIYPGTKKMIVNSGNNKLAVLQYYPTGKGPHPTLILLHGYTGMSGNIDIAATLSRAGWNVIFFRYRGSWGMPGEFTFQNCVEDAVNIANYCKVNARSMHIDTSQIALFGHSMGGWVALKAASRLPFVKKAFALSTWDIYKTANDAKTKGTIDKWYLEAEGFSEIKITSGKWLYEPVFRDSTAFILTNNGLQVAGKKLFFLDEHYNNKYIVEDLKKYTPQIQYDVWKSDHSFTYTRIAMLQKLMAFLNE
jgi:pimeloyl-ACP methyl ester carboxylesterase